MSHVYIYTPPVTERAIHRASCVDCKRPTRMLSFWQDWHGWHSTCIRCGRQWDGGEWLPLEFRRGVRKQNIQSAKRRWRKLTRTGLAKSDVFA